MLGIASSKWQVANCKPEKIGFDYIRCSFWQEEIYFKEDPSSGSLGGVPSALLRTGSAAASGGRGPHTLPSLCWGKGFMTHLRCERAFRAAMLSKIKAVEICQVPRSCGFIKVFNPRPWSSYLMVPSCRARWRSKPPRTSKSSKIVARI